MKAIRWRTVLVSVTATLIVLSASAAPPPANPKFQKLNADLEHAATLQQVAQVFKQAGLSPAEQKQFETAMSPALALKIDTLITQARAAGKANAKRTSTQRLEAARRNKALRVKAPANLSAALARARAARPPTRQTMMATARPPAAPTSASITSVSPATVLVGKTLTINGNGFGPLPGGKVRALLGPHDRFDCAPTSWTATRIVVTVSLEIEPLVREASMAGYIQVFPAGESGGPWAEVTYAPDPARLTPEITSVAPDPMSTKQNVLVNGRNFLSSRPGTVTLTGRTAVGPTSYPIEVTEWTDTYIYGYVPERGAPERSEALQLVVRNHLGREGTRAVGYEVATELRTVKMTSRRIHCEVWRDDKDRPSAICLVGQKKDYSFAWGTCDLRVVDSGYDILDESGAHGFAWVSEPRGEYVSGHYEIWAELYSWFEVEPWVVVEVPVGADCGRDPY
jgi:hypothetical protein